jgi:zinc protease
VNTRDGRLPIQRPLFALLLVLGLTALVAPARAMDPAGIEEHMLPNGMKVLLWEDPTIPNLAIYTFWKVGSRNEAPGITGLAHFFEHMMFNGSKKYPPGEFDRTMEAAGGSNNAYTSNDVTVYQDWVPAAALDLTLDLEQDRIGYLAVAPEVVQSERGVVISERERGEDSNQNLMNEILYSSAYMAHPYSWPVIGWRSDIENWRQEDVENFFRSWYTPNNAVMVVCGAFNRDELLAKLTATVGSLPAREIPRGVVTQEPAQRGERRAELRKEAGMGSLFIGWHVPETAHADLRVIELANLVLTRGESSRLYRRLVDRDQLALWAEGFTDSNFDPGLYQILVQSREGVDGPKVEAALFDEVDRLKTVPLTADDLTKAKNMLIAGFYNDMATISGRAQALGSFELFHGGWKNVFDVVHEYEAITPEDVMRVAGTYFTADNRTIVTLIPTPAEEGEEAGR